MVVWWVVHFSHLVSGGYPVMPRQVNQVLWDQWRQRIKRQRESGLSIAEFCRRENISGHGFYVWRRNLREVSRRRREPRADARLQRSRRRSAGSRRAARFASPVGSAAACDGLPATAGHGGTSNDPWIEVGLARRHRHSLAPAESCGAGYRVACASRRTIGVAVWSAPSCLAFLRRFASSCMLCRRI